MTAKDLLSAAQLIDKGGCARCGVINAIASIPHLELARVYKARLCDKCANDWDRSMFDDPDWRAVEDLEDDIKIEHTLMFKDGREQRGATIRRCRTLQREAYRRLMDKAEMWVALGVSPLPRIRE